MRSLKNQLYLFVFGPIFIAVVIMLIQNSILMSKVTNQALTTMKDHFKQMGIIYVKSKNLIQKTSIEIQYSNYLQHISIMKSFLQKQFRNQVIISPNLNLSRMVSDLVKLSNRQNYYTLDETIERNYFAWNSINQQTQSYADWTDDEKTYLSNMITYYFRIVPTIFYGKDFYSIDPQSGLLISYPLRSDIPQYTEGTSYNPLNLNWFQKSSDKSQPQKGEFTFNQPFWNGKLLTPFCSQVEDLNNTLRSIVCINLEFNKTLKRLKAGIDLYLKQVYSYLIYPVTREIIAQTDYVQNRVETLDEFEYGKNYSNSKNYQDFKQQTQFINDDTLVEKDKKRCSFDLKDDVRNIDFIDENKEAFLLVVRSITFCEKNNKGLFNLLRVSYLGTAINMSQLNEFVLQKTMTMSITQELSLLISIIIVCGVSLSVVFMGIYFAEQIFTPIENLTKGLKRLDVESIKVVYKKLEKIQKAEDRSEVYMPLSAYYNLIELVSEANKLYGSGQLAEAQKLFQNSQQIYDYLENKEGYSICLHNQGIILINEGRHTEGMELIQQSLDICWRERYSIEQKFLTQGITEEELLTDERYYHILITICRRTFNLIEANMILLRQFQMGDRLKKVNSEKVIDLINDIIKIQDQLCSFGKITSIFIYAKIQLSFFYYLQDDLTAALKAYKDAEDAYDGYFPKLNYNPVNTFPLCILHQALLVQKGLIEEKMQNYQNAALLFTISLEEIEEYKPDLKEEAILGLERIFSKHHIESADLNMNLQNFQKSVNDLFFLIDLNLSGKFLALVVQTREKIIKYLCNQEDRISQLSLSDKLFINYFKISSSDIYLRQEGSEMLEHFESTSSHLQEGLMNIYTKIDKKVTSTYINQSEDFYVQFRATISQIKQPIKNQKKVLFIFTDLSKLLLNVITDQHLSELSENYTIIMVDLSQDYVNTDQMFNKIVLSENLNNYHYFNFNSINDTLIQSWRYLIREPNTNFKFNMENFQ